MVKEGEDAVECEKCMHWFHSKCQGISKAALTALGKWHGTFVWLCSSCMASLKDKPVISNTGLGQVEETVSKLEKMVRHNANALNEVIKNQDIMFTGQCKLTEKMAKEAHPQKSYAEAIKGVGAEVVDQVSKKIDKMPSVAIPVQRSNEEIAGILDEMQDKERRKHNIVIHNLSEAEGESQSERAKGSEIKFKVMVKEGMKLMVETSKTFRVGKKVDHKPRLMVVTLTNMSDKREILRLAASLRDSEWNKVFITPDLTWKEREAGRQLRNELGRRKEAGEQHIWIRRGRIVQIPAEKRYPSTAGAQTMRGGNSPTQQQPAEQAVSQPARPEMVLDNQQY